MNWNIAFNEVYTNLFLNIFFLSIGIILSLILCPITKKMLIAARPYYKSDCSGFEFMPVKDEMVDKLNELMCFNAQRFVYASEKSQELLGYIRKAKGTHKSFKSYRFGDAIIGKWDINLSGEIKPIRP